MRAAVVGQAADPLGRGDGDREQVYAARRACVDSRLVPGAVAVDDPGPARAGDGDDQPAGSAGERMDEWLEQ